MRLRLFTFVIGCLCVAACGSTTKPTAAHSQTPSATPAPTEIPAGTPVAIASHTPSPMDVFKAQYGKVDSQSWVQASLGMKSANSQQQVKDVLTAELAALQKYRSGLVALQAPPDDQLAAPLSRPLAANIAAIDTLEAAVQQLQADVNRGDENAFNHDGDSTYSPAYDALTKAGNELDTAVQVDTPG